MKLQHVVNGNYKGQEKILHTSIGLLQLGNLKSLAVDVPPNSVASSYLGIQFL